MILYRFGENVAANYSNFLSTILNSDVNGYFEIDCRDVDFYLTDVIKNYKVYKVKDPRLSQIFGSYEIPGRVKLRGEWRSYVRQKYDPSTGIIHAERYYKNKLIEECYYHAITKLVQKHVYYGHNPKLSPTVLTMTEGEETFEYNRHYHLLGKNDYDKYVLDLEECNIVSNCKRTLGKDWYTTSRSTEELDNVHEVLVRVYTFNYLDFMHGKQYFGYIPRG